MKEKSKRTWLASERRGRGCKPCRLSGWLKFSLELPAETSPEGEVSRLCRVFHPLSKKQESERQKAFPLLQRWACKANQGGTAEVTSCPWQEVFYFMEICTFVLECANLLLFCEVLKNSAQGKGG